MPAHDISESLETSQVSTDNLASVDNTRPGPAGGDLYPPQGPAPDGTKPRAIREMERDTLAQDGEGIEGEEVVWEGRYVMKNFLGRLIWRILATGVLVGIAIYSWGYGHRAMIVPTTVFGVFLLGAWVAIGYRIVRASLGHFYRLTSRRLFVSTGVFQRRRDQLELLRVADVFTQQSWFERLLSVGTVVVVPSEKALPTFYMPGVEDPKRVMDLVWHYARTERDLRSVRVQEV